jgi:colanic acid/amylovoran biosynthesis glycosyltransferase
VDIVYVTSRFPFGAGEAFLGPEISAHVASGANVHVFPMWPKGGRVHAYATDLAPQVEWEGPVNAARATARGMAAAPSGLVRGAAAAGTTGPIRVRGRNVAILPRAAALIDLIRRRRPDHLHVHWGGASSTMAMIASEATGTSWSMTLHRWDIAADNLLARKIASACFTRVISQSGAAQVEAVVPGARVEVIHMGIEAPADESAPPPEVDSRRVVCIASLVPVKNHAELLRAFAELAPDERVGLDLIGDGPLRPELTALVRDLNLSGRVRFLGTLGHEDVIRRLRSHEWLGVVLASSASRDEHEGIPVSLMEAMAAGVPVIATNSGGTAELVGGGAGLLVPVGDRPALTEALSNVIADDALRIRLADSGRRRVLESFDVDTIAAELRRRFSACAG